VTLSVDVTASSVAAANDVIDCWSTDTAQSRRETDVKQRSDRISCELN